MNSSCISEGFVYFVRVDDLRPDPIPTNAYAPIWSQGALECLGQPRYVYLFNVQPGRYAPVAVSFGKGIVNAYLPQQAIERLTVTVGEGEVVFVGDIDVGTSISPPSLWTSVRGSASGPFASCSR